MTTKVRLRTRHGQRSAPHEHAVAAVLRYWCRRLIERVKDCGHYGCAIEGIAAAPRFRAKG